MQCKTMKNALNTNNDALRRLPACRRLQFNLMVVELIDIKAGWRGACTFPECFYFLRLQTAITPRFRGKYLHFHSTTAKNVSPLQCECI